MWRNLVSAIDNPDTRIEGALRMFRVHLGLDVAFVSQLTDGVRVFRHVDADDRSIIDVGQSNPAEESYCNYVAAGAMPEFMLDSATDPIAIKLAATSQLPIGTYFSIPLVFSNGEIYGAFCGFSYKVLYHLSKEDLTVVRGLAGLVAGYIEQSESERQRVDQRRRQLLELEAGRNFSIWLQPIVELECGSWIGFEALARFPDFACGPAAVFAEAADLNIGVELELGAIRAATDLLASLPAHVYLSVNAGPETLLDPQLTDLVRSVDAEQIVLELTEHTHVTDYPILKDAIRKLTSLGARLAIDDVGTGFSGLRHILELEPHILKLDGVLVRDIDTCPDKQATVGMLATFARDSGAAVIAEQVETIEELAMLTALGATNAQGNLLARPAPIETLFADPTTTVFARAFQRHRAELAAVQLVS